MSEHVERLRVLTVAYSSLSTLSVPSDDLRALLADYDALRATPNEADARRWRWICNGHGYFLEEHGLCGHWNEKAAADAAIDAAMEEGK